MGLVVIWGERVWCSGSGSFVHVSGIIVQGSGFMVHGSGSIVQGSGSVVHGLGFIDHRPRLRVYVSCLLPVVQKITASAAVKPLRSEDD